MTKRFPIAHRRCVNWAPRLSLLALGSILTLSVANAQNTTGSLSAAPAPQAGAHADQNRTHPAAKVARPYAIEFRARSAQSYGHTFSIYGRVNAQGKLISPKVSGLHPATESPVPWMIGHLVLVPSETGASDGDTEDQYVISRFRMALSESEYKKVTGYIKYLSGKNPVWHAVLNNCNGFVGDIARFMGLRTPDSTMLMPQDYVDRLRDLNLTRTDLAGVIGIPVKVEDAAALRAAALKAIEEKDTHPKRLAAAKPASKPAAAKQTSEASARSTAKTQ